jgi:hypothetical protein
MSDARIGNLFASISSLLIESRALIEDAQGADRDNVAKNQKLENVKPRLIIVEGLTRMLTDKAELLDKKLRAALQKKKKLRAALAALQKKKKR